jgi:hypothetical protein
MNDHDPPTDGLAVEMVQTARLAELRQEHQDLDAAIEALASLPLPDQLQIARLKKKKLALRDDIARLAGMLRPDIIA